MTVTVTDNTPTVTITQDGARGAAGADGADGAGFDQVRRSLLDNPVSHFFKKNNVDAVSSSPLVFARSTTSTYINRYGKGVAAAIDESRQVSYGWLIEPASTNSALRSSEIDNASWTKSEATITANTTTAPDSSGTADKLVESVTSSVSHTVLQTIVGDATVPNSGSFFVKASGRDKVRLRLDDGAGSNKAEARFDLVAKTVVSVADSGLSSGGAATITEVDNDWFRITISCTPSTSGTSVRLTVYTEDSGGSITYTGDGSSGLFLWGGQIEELEFATTYIPTFGSPVSRSFDVFSAPSNGNMPDTTKAHAITFSAKFLNGIAGNSRILTVKTSSLDQYLVAWSSTSITWFFNNSNGDSLTYAVDTTAGIDVALVFNGTDILMYIDGVLRASDTSVVAESLDLTSSVYLGSRDGTQSFMGGAIMNLKFHDLGLNPSEATYLSGV